MKLVVKDPVQYKDVRNKGVLRCSKGRGYCLTRLTSPRTGYEPGLQRFSSGTTSATPFHTSTTTASDRRSCTHGNRRQTTTNAKSAFSSVRACSIRHPTSARRGTGDSPIPTCKHAHITSFLQAILSHFQRPRKTKPWDHDNVMLAHVLSFRPELANHPFVAETEKERQARLNPPCDTPRHRLEVKHAATMHSNSLAFTHAHTTCYYAPNCVSNMNVLIESFRTISCSTRPRCST